MRIGFNILSATLNFAPSIPNKIPIITAKGTDTAIAASVFIDSVQIPLRLNIAKYKTQAPPKIAKLTPLRYKPKSITKPKIITQGIGPKGMVLKPL